VTAEVEAVAVADLGLGDSADLVLGLENDHRPALLGEQVARGQPGGTAAEHRDRLARRAPVEAGLAWWTEFDSRHGCHDARPGCGRARRLMTANRP
jgi:hypothetical protein